MPKVILAQYSKHQCPLYDGKSPHRGGKVMNGVTNVKVNGYPIATVNSLLKCNGAPATIISGAQTVLIGGLPVATELSQTNHGSVLQVGEASVLIE